MENIDQQQNQLHYQKPQLIGSWWGDQQEKEQFIIEIQGIQIQNKLKFVGNFLINQLSYPISGQISFTLKKITCELQYINGIKYTFDYTQQESQRYNGKVEYKQEEGGEQMELLSELKVQGVGGLFYGDFKGKYIEEQLIQSIGDISGQFYIYITDMQVRDEIQFEADYYDEQSNQQINGKLSGNMKEMVFEIMNNNEQQCRFILKRASRSTLYQGICQNGVIDQQQQRNVEVSVLQMRKFKQLLYTANFVGNSDYVGCENFEIYIKYMKLQKELKFEGNLYDQNGKAKIKGFITLDFSLIVYEQKYCKEFRQSNPQLNDIIHYQYKQDKDNTEKYNGKFKQKDTGYSTLYIKDIHTITNIVKFPNFKGYWIGQLNNQRNFQAIILKVTLENSQIQFKAEFYDNMGRSIVHGFFSLNLNEIQFTQTYEEHAIKNGAIKTPVSHIYKLTENNKYSGNYSYVQKESKIQGNTVLETLNISIIEAFKNTNL